MEQGLASAKTTLASLEKMVGEFKALIPAAPSTLSRSQEPQQSPELGEPDVEEAEIEVDAETIECAVCDNEIRPDLIIDHSFRS